MSGPGTIVTTTDPTRKTRRWCGTGGSYGSFELDSDGSTDVLEMKNTNP
jgi:hypothetical protein